MGQWHSRKSSHSSYAPPVRPPSRDPHLLDPLCVQSEVIVQSSSQPQATIELTSLSFLPLSLSLSHLYLFLHFRRMTASLSTFSIIFSQVKIVQMFLYLDT